MSNEKSEYSSHNFLVKTITTMSDIAKSVLLPSDISSSVRQIHDVNTVKAYMNGITLLGHLLAESKQKRKNNFWNIVYKSYSIMWTKTRLS